MGDPAFSALLLGLLPVRDREELTPRTLELDAIWQQARNQWSEIEVDPAPFAAHVVGHRPDPFNADHWLASLCMEDLLLAYACSEGNAIALAEFHRLYGDLVASIARRYRGPRNPGDDLAQVVFIKLLVGTSRRIQSFTGRGRLRNYVSVTAVRACLDEVKGGAQAKRETPSSDVLAQAVIKAGDVEMEFLKQEHRFLFKEAFAAAVTRLSSDQRNVLRQHLVRRLSVDQIAGLYKVHRSTAARRVSRAKTALLKATRRELVDRLGVTTDAEVVSAIGQVQSQLELSLSRLFPEVPNDLPE